MSRRFRIAYFAHAVRSDWNNGNAHFLRGLLRSLGQCGHQVEIFEPEDGWSIENLRQEEKGEQSLRQFEQVYPDLRVSTYVAADATGWGAADRWREALRGDGYRDYARVESAGACALPIGFAGGASVSPAVS